MLNWLKRLISGPPAPQAESRVCTVTFTNMADYVGIAETVPQADLPVFMSEYYETQGQAIDTNGGTVSPHIGDNILSVWDQPDIAQLAC